MHSGPETNNLVFATNESKSQPTILGPAAIACGIAVPESQVNIVEIEPVKPVGVANFHRCEDISIQEHIQIGPRRIDIGISQAGNRIEIRSQLGSDRLPKPRIGGVDR